VVKTGSSFGAGTDSTIFVEFIGDQGHTPRITLNSEVSHEKKADLFEKGSTDTFNVQSVNIGKVHLFSKLNKI
jgi:hypothetical protein